MHLSKIAYISLVVREHLDPRTCIVIGALQTHRCGIHQAVNNPSRSTASCVPAVFSCSYESRWPLTDCRPGVDIRNLLSVTSATWSALRLHGKELNLVEVADSTRNIASPPPTSQPKCA